MLEEELSTISLLLNSVSSDGVENVSFFRNGQGTEPWSLRSGEGEMCYESFRIGG